MPELAEVEFYRKCWNPGLNQKISDVSLHQEKRVFRRTNTSQFVKLLPGTKFVSSEAKGKQLLFHFTRDLWLNVHLGMSGELRLEKASFSPGKHDHLVLFQRDRALVFADQRQFGRLDLYQSRKAPAFWRNLPPSILSDDFSIAGMQEFLSRHAKLPIKATRLTKACCKSQIVLDRFPDVASYLSRKITLSQDRIFWQREHQTAVLPLMVSRWRGIKWIGQRPDRFQRSWKSQSFGGSENEEPLDS